jgi:NAD+ synthase
MNARPADKLAIAVAQLNSTVGDIAGNVEKVKRARETAAAQGADLVVFPELFIAGYPPEDLVLKPAFQAGCRSAVEALARETASAGPSVLLGTPWLGCDTKVIFRTTESLTKSGCSRRVRCRAR